MKQFLLSILFVVGVNRCFGQVSTSQTLVQFGNGWKKDSLCCDGYRSKVAELVLSSRVDSISTDILVKSFGSPNKIQGFSSGFGQDRKKYVGYVYYVYKDDCPNVKFEGRALQFVFIEAQGRLTAIEDIIYCR